MLDVPLLFETKGETDCDVVVVVSTKSEAIQRSRVLARPRMTPDTLAMILDKQVPDAEKRERADFVIDTSSPCLTAMRCQVAELVGSLADAFPGPFRDKVLERGDRSSTALVAVRGHAPLSHCRTKRGRNMRGRPESSSCSDLVSRADTDARAHSTDGV